MRATRFNLRLPVRYRPSGHSVWHDGTTENISRSGVLFHAAGILDVNTPIEMRLALPVGATPEILPEVICSGRIVRTIRPSGVEQRAGLAVAITDYRLRPGSSETSES